MNSQDRRIVKAITELSDRLAEDRLYKITADEMKAGSFDEVAQLRALEESEGYEKKAKAFYPKHRVRRLMDLRAEIILEEAAAAAAAAAEIILEEAAAAAAAAEEKAKRMATSANINMRRLSDSKIKDTLKKRRW